MTHKNTRRGFTLIELLVVVLIIAILAAVAVPQYQVAIAKTRFSELFPIVKAIKEAQEVYYLAHGEYATTINNLDITWPGNGQIDPSDTNYERFVYPNGNEFRVYVQGKVIGSTKKFGQLEVALAHAENNLQGYERVCHNQNSTMGTKVCKALGGVGPFNTYYYGLP